MAHRRTACLEIPLFPLAARLRSEPQLRQAAVAVLAGDPPRIVAANRHARRSGVRQGQTLSEAEILCPGLLTRQRSPGCEDAAREAVLDVAGGFSPRLEDAGSGLVFLDAGGVERRYPGPNPEEDFGRSLMLAVDRGVGIPVRVGIASGKLAARLAARRPGSPVVIPAAAEADFLASLPLAEITSGETREILELWGIGTLGQLRALPEAEVAGRLGEAASRLLSIARGEDPEPLVPRERPLTLSEGLELEWPLDNLEPFVFIARDALERLTRRLASRALGCARLELALELEPGGHHLRAIELSSPTRDPKTLLMLLRLDLESHPPAAPITALTLTAYPDRPRTSQLALFGPAEVSPDRLATATARLAALLGRERVGSPRPLDAHRPEGMETVAFEPSSSAAGDPPPRPRKVGLVAVRALRPPLPIEVLTDEVEAPVNDSRRPPAARPDFIKTLAGEAGEKRPRIHGRVQVASGPWNLEEAWWAERATGRDYWDVELQAGELYRIFRDRRSDGWYADGVYD